MSVGTNDKNPYGLITELCNVMSKFKDNKIFILSVYSNPYLNVSKLNYDLKSIIKGYSKCTFLSYDHHQAPGTSLLDIISSKINIEIDYIQYDNEFIKNWTQLRKLYLISRQNNNVIKVLKPIRSPKMLQKEKITDYFPKKVLE